MTNIEKIVDAARASDLAFIEKQKEELARLQFLIEKKNRGESVEAEISAIRASLQKAGILDKKTGKLAKMYVTGEKK